MYTLTTSNLSAGNIKYQKFGHMVMVVFDGLTVSSTGTKVVGTLPTGYRPTITSQPFIRDSGGSSVLQSWIMTDGAINITFKTAGLAYAGFVVFTAE